jgi:hypothetical protein
MHMVRPVMSEMMLCGGFLLFLLVMAIVVFIRRRKNLRLTGARVGTLRERYTRAIAIFFCGGALFELAVRFVYPLVENRLTLLDVTQCVLFIALAVINLLRMNDSWMGESGVCLAGRFFAWADLESLDVSRGASIVVRARGPYSLTVTYDEAAITVFRARNIPVREEPGGKTATA